MLKKLGLHFGDNLFNRAKSPFIEIPECNIVISCTLMDSGFTTGAFDFIGFSIPRSKLANHFPTIGLDVRITLIRQEKQKHCSSCQRNKIDGNISSNDYHDVDAIPEDEASRHIKLLPGSSLLYNSTPKAILRAPSRSKIRILQSHDHIAAAWDNQGFEADWKESGIIKIPKKSELKKCGN